MARAPTKITPEHPYSSLEFSIQYADRTKKKKNDNNRNPVLRGRADFSKSTVKRKKTSIKRRKSYRTHSDTNAIRVFRARLPEANGKKKTESWSSV